MFADYVDDLNEADHKDGFEDSNDLFENNGDDEIINNCLHGTVHNNCRYFYS